MGLRLNYSCLQCYLKSHLNQSFSHSSLSVLKRQYSFLLNRKLETFSSSASKRFDLLQTNYKLKRNISVTAQKKNEDKYPILTPKSDEYGHTILDRYIYVKTLDTLYEDVTNGIVLDTAYGDSRPGTDFDPSVPVVVALHDTPGTHKDVVPLLTFFAKLGCRTICPTFPGHGDTRGIVRNYDDIFSQITMERATFVHDFLDDLGIKRVDVLIGVGAASYTAMALCSRINEVYRSMALISPWPLTKPRFEIDSRVLKYIVELWEMVYFRPIVRLFLPAFSIGNATTTQEKISACYLVENIDLGEADGFALTAAIRNVPRLVAYGAKDDLISEEMYTDVLSKLGIDGDKVTSCHQGMSIGKLNLPGALVYPELGYDIMSPLESTLCAYILRLLQQFHPHIRI